MMPKSDLMGKEIIASLAKDGMEGEKPRGMNYILTDGERAPITNSIKRAVNKWRAQHPEMTANLTPMLKDGRLCWKFFMETKDLSEVWRTKLVGWVEIQTLN